MKTSDSYLRHPTSDLQPPTSDLSPPAPRCSFTFRDGRRCRMIRSPDHPALCPDHARRKQDDNAAPPTLLPLATCDALDSPTSVRRALRRLARAVADEHIPLRQAEIMAHILRLLLISNRRRGPAVRRLNAKIPRRNGGGERGEDGGHPSAALRT